jgi:hypothetical protein
MPAGAQLRVEQLSVHADFELSPVRWNQGQGFDLRFEFFEQVDCQTGSLVGVMSDRTVNQLDFQQHDGPPM